MERDNHLEKMLHEILSKIEELELSRKNVLDVKEIKTLLPDTEITLC